MLKDAHLRVDALGDGVLRLRYTLGPLEPVASVVLIPPVTPPSLQVRETDDAVECGTTGLTVRIDRATGAARFVDATGRTILAEKPGGRTIRASEVGGEPTLDVSQTFVSPASEHLLGTGQFQDGALDLRDLPRRLTQVNSQIAIPFILSGSGCGLLWHNYGLTEFNPARERVELHRAGEVGEAVAVEVTSAEGTTSEVRRACVFLGTLNVGKSGRFAFMLDCGQKMARRYHVEIDGVVVVDLANYWLPPTTSWHLNLEAGSHSVRVIGEAADVPTLFVRPSADETVLASPVADALDYVVFAGPEADDVIARYRIATGHVPMPPAWALGYIHCRERFHSQAELLDTAREFRSRRLPLGLIVQDWMYWGKYGWNAMRFDEDSYPDPAAMVCDLHEMGLRLMVSVWSKFDRRTDLGQTCSEREYFVPGTEWVDFFKPAAAAFYWESFRERMLPLGIDAWWQDATEPENDDLAGRRTHAGAGEKVRNLFPLMVAKTVYEGLRRDLPDQRAMVLTRCAFAGSQRYAASTWSGDIGNDWETLRRQVAAGLNYCASGLPWWTTDCGGFFRPGPGQFTDDAYRERLARWLEYAVFCPLLRVHGYQTDTEFWRYGEAVESHARAYLELRSRLLPYLYSAAARVTFAGSTLMRPLLMDFAHDPAALDRAAQFMFGPALLVAPVLAPDARSWDVYLPQWDGGWFDFWTGTAVGDGKTVSTPAPIGRIPLHVRAGSIVPLGPVSQQPQVRTDEPIELRVYPGRDGTFDLYEDDGTTYAYESGLHATTPIRWDDSAGILTLGARRGQFPGMSSQRAFTIVRVAPGRGVGGKSTEGIDIQYDGRPIAVDLRKGAL